jgi:hypothetical protein
MREILRSRINLGTWAVFVVLVILALQNALSEDISVGNVHFYGVLDLNSHAKRLIWNTTKVAVFLPVIVFWFLDRRGALWKAVAASNALLTLDLLVSTSLLVANLATDASGRVNMLIRDTLLVMIINLLIFSLWYWIADSPKLKQGTGREKGRWDFLFPQRLSSIPNYGNWVPDYLDYFYLAFTTSFTFGPADTLPLSRRAKMLMILQVAVSVINIVVLAGYALSII